MPIKQFDDRLRVSIAGKIRLGERTATEGKSGFPKNVGYFNLSDAPNVEKVYGPNPTELHVQFISPTRNEAAPYFLKWYTGGYMDSNGERHGGDLQCRGDGEVAYHYAAKDKLTGEVPTRKCLYQNCPDWGKGCKEAMNIFCILPLVSSLDVYQIDSTSKTNIMEFHSNLKFIEERYGRVDKFTYRIFRYQKDMEYFDKKSQSLKKTKPWLLGIDIGYGFSEQFKDKLIAAEKYLATAEYTAPRISYSEALPRLIDAPMEDNYPLLEHNKVWSDDELKEICNLPDVVAAFDALAAKKGKENNERNRFLTIKRFHESENPHTEIINYVNLKLQES